MKQVPTAKIAYYYKQLPDGKVECLLCLHQCLIVDGATGRCRSRTNFHGILYAVNYGLSVSVQSDPIEKKPLFHFHPGTKIISLGGNSCNLQCSFCQNFSISQELTDTMYISPAMLIELCTRSKCTQVAFTYTEPVTWFEYVLDCAKALRAANIDVVLITNGYIQEQPLRELLQYVSAMNIDLKSIENQFYQELCNGTVEPVLRTIQIAAESTHVEITNLVIPKKNDSIEQLEHLIDFIAQVNPLIPLHFSRYFPRYKMKEPTTPIETLHKAYDLAKKKLTNVYIGNVDLPYHTYCPNCNAKLIDRTNYSGVSQVLNTGHCPQCGLPIYGVFA